MPSDDSQSTTPTWKMMAVVYPEFVQWVVQKFGPVPEGPIDRNMWDKYREEYLLAYPAEVT